MSAITNKNRQQAIEVIVKDRTEYDHNTAYLQDVLIHGFKGFENFTNEELSIDINDLMDNEGFEGSVDEFLKARLK